MNQGINLTAICIGDGFGAFLAIMMLGAKIWKNGRNEREGKLIRLMLYTAVISCIADILAFSFDGLPGTGAFLAVYAGNFWLYLSNMLMGTLWVMVVVSHISGKHLPKPQVILTAVLDILGAACLLLNFFLPLVFSVSPENVYAREPMFWLYMAIEIIFTIDGVIMYFVVRGKKKGGKILPGLAVRYSDPDRHCRSVTGLRRLHDLAGTDDRDLRNHPRPVQ